MRVTYRRSASKQYWSKRWADIPADSPMENFNAYPLKYANLTIRSKEGKILEAGCGAGRVLRFYKNRGYDILGIDYIDTAVEKLKKIDPELNVEVGDISALKYRDRCFRYILAFGLYHNFTNESLRKAVRETYRVLENGGRLCASFRADNIQTWLTDWLAEYRVRKGGVKTPATKFHKLNLKKREFVDLFKKTGFHIEDVYSVENMPILYKFAFFRCKKHKVFCENLARKEGYKLSILGNIIQKFLMRFFPDQVCNIFVIIASKL